MSINKSDIDKVVGLDKAEFEKRLKNAVSTAGLDKNISTLLLKDSEKIKSALSGLQSEDIAKLSKILENNKLDAIEKIIKDDIGG